MVRWRSLNERTHTTQFLCRQRAAPSLIASSWHSGVMIAGGTEIEIVTGNVATTVGLTFASMGPSAFRPRVLACEEFR
jgi:hypothetical protein